MPPSLSLSMPPSLPSHEPSPGVFFNPSGELSYAGAALGQGYNINIPLPYRPGGYADHDYDAILHQIILPVSVKFAPQLVVIAAGFDACVGDPIGGSRVTAEWFGRCTALLKVYFQ
jgi:histone deacetylase 6